MDVHSKFPRKQTTIFAVMSQLAAEHSAVNLGQGFPDFPVPQFLQEALVKAMREGRNQYAPMHGIAPLREQIAAKIAAIYGANVDAEREITVTSGATEALFAAIHAVARAGDEVVVLDPCYDCYAPAIELAGARAVHVPMARAEDGVFYVDWQRVKDAFTARTRLLIVNTPGNPTGAVFSREDMDTLADVLRDTEVLLISDEVYEHIVFDGQMHHSVLRHAELAQRSFVISSFGKTYHCTGWKLGYAIAPAALTADFRQVHQFLTFCAFNPAQWALAEMMEHHPEHALELPAFYQQKRDRFVQLLADTRFTLPKVQGAYFQLADYSALVPEVGDLSDVEFARWLTIEKGVTGIPLSPFYESPPQNQRLIRFCFAKADATQLAAAERLRGL